MYRVIGTAEFDKSLEELKLRARNGDFDSAKLLILIEKGIEKLKYDFKYGEHISKSKIPKEYTMKYGNISLWKLNLNQYWRMVYIVKGNEIEVISILLEVLDHKIYDRKFGYKTS